jgi:hypothetical protein
MRFAPKISPALPASGIMAVAASWLTLKIHPASISEALKSCVITGKATETLVPLIDTSKKDRLPIAKTIYRDISNSLAQDVAGNKIKVVIIALLEKLSYN